MITIIGSLWLCRNVANHLFAVAGKKIAVAQSMSGDVPESNLDSLNQDGDSVEMALAS